MSPTVSVVIPVYNVESYLHRCIDSILNQTFQDFEVILINDGSIDNSGQICDQFAHQDDRITVIHKENARVSAARNDGIRLAKGKYISFIDSDDWVEPEMLCEMVKKAEEMSLDIIMCDYKKKSNDNEMKMSQPIRGRYYSKEDIREELYRCLIMFDHLELPPTISNWVCLFNLKFLRENQLHYDEDIHYCEDSLFGSKALYHANNFYYLKGHYFYNYFYNPCSTTNTYNAKKWDSYLKINERLKRYFAEESVFDFSKQLKINMLYFTLNALGQIKYSGSNAQEREKMIRDIMNHPKVGDVFYRFEFPNVSWKMKVTILMIKFKLAKTYNYLVLKTKEN
ncbi:glycosyltransferase family 2 protein [Mesobacillus jeotgali]|uniref:glycosyltransferase family 2 protein n=1 Tax=Mesobacillus jeotgali TaxID=129985 RepID=UPI001CFEB645|nr:glycosyltransferase family 2 protein [Mesobacillus jeotgali]